MKAQGAQDQAGASKINQFVGYQIDGPTGPRLYVGMLTEEGTSLGVPVRWFTSKETAQKFLSEATDESMATEILAVAHDGMPGTYEFLRDGKRLAAGDLWKEVDREDVYMLVTACHEMAITKLSAWIEWAKSGET